MITVYTKDFIARMKDLAVIGLSPAQIAERMGLEGIDRSSFLHNITQEDHPLHKEYFLASRHYHEDMDAALSTSALFGDPKALRLAYELNHQNKVDDLKKELFGI